MNVNIYIHENGVTAAPVLKKVCPPKRQSRHSQNRREGATTGKWMTKKTMQLSTTKLTDPLPLSFPLPLFPFTFPFNDGVASTPTPTYDDDATMTLQR